MALNACPLPNVALSSPIGYRMFHGLVALAKQINVWAASQATITPPPSLNQTVVIPLIRSPLADILSPQNCHRSHASGQRSVWASSLDPTHLFLDHFSHFPVRPK